MLIHILLFFGGLIGLVVGAEFLVRGAGRLALRVGITPLVVGLTVVAFGTSAPELFIGIGATLQGNADVAIGNVVGSNIANVLLILGIASIISPLSVSKSLVRFDVPVMIGLTILVALAALTGSLSRWFGITLFVILLVYLYTLIKLATSGRHQLLPAIDPEETKKTYSVGPQVVLVILGLILLAVGSKYLVDGAVGIALTLGVTPLVVGLTVVAIGTSAPEIATSVIATMRNESDLAVGNVIGSNILNLVLVLAACAIVAPTVLQIPASAIRLDIPVMLLCAAICFPMFIRGFTITRWEGVAFLVFYGAYLTYLVMDAGRHPAADEFGKAFGFVLVPLFILTIVVFAYKALRRRSFVRRPKPKGDE